MPDGAFFRYEAAETAMAAAFARAGVGGRERLYTAAVNILRRRRGPAAESDAAALAAVAKSDPALLAALVGDDVITAAAERLLRAVAADMDGDKFKGTAAAGGGAGENRIARKGDKRFARPVAPQQGNDGGGDATNARKGEKGFAPVVAGGGGGTAHARKGDFAGSPSPPINPAGDARPATGAGEMIFARKGEYPYARPGQPHKPPGRVAGLLNTPGAAEAAGRMLERQGMSPLDSILINGKPLRRCTAHEALVHAERLEGRAAIIKALCAGLPPTGKVGDYISDAEAARIAGRLK